MARARIVAGGIQNPTRAHRYAALDWVLKKLHFYLPIAVVAFSFYTKGLLWGVGITLLVLALFSALGRFKNVKKNHILVVTNLITGEVHKLYTGLNFIYLHWWIESEVNDEEALTVQSTPPGKRSTVTTKDGQAFDIEWLAQYRASMPFLNVYFTIDSDNSQINRYVTATFESLLSEVVKDIDTTTDAGKAALRQEAVKVAVLEKFRTAQTVAMAGEVDENGNAIPKGGEIAVTRSFEQRYGICDIDFLISDFDPDSELAKILTEKVRIKQLGKQLTESAEEIMRLDTAFFTSEEFLARVAAKVHEGRNENPPLDQATARALVIDQLAKERNINSEAAHNLAAVAGGITKKEIKENRNTTVIENKDAASALLAFIKSFKS